MQSTGVYKVNELDKPPKKHKKLKRFIVFLIFVVICVCVFIYIRDHLKTKTTIKNAKPVVTKIENTEPLKEYDEPDFVVKVPASWQPVSQLSPAYRSYTWQTSANGTGGQQLTIYEDSIPPNYAVNRTVIVHAEGDQIATDGIASDNCIQYTISGAPQYGEFGNLAKWQGVEFICDTRNGLRDVIGTSSTDGLNLVHVTGTVSRTHSYFFTLDNQDNASPNYDALYTTIQNFEAK